MKRRPRSLAALGVICTILAFGVAAGVRLSADPAASARGGGPVGPPSLADYGIAAMLDPGRRMDWADIELVNRGSRSATITGVTAHRGRSPAPVDIEQVRVLGPNARPAGGTTTPDSATTFWHTDLAPAIGYVIPPRANPVKETVLLLTLGPTAPWISWLQGVDISYTAGGHHYTTYVPAILTFCSSSVARSDCVADGWKKTK